MIGQVDEAHGESQVSSRRFLSARAIVVEITRVLTERTPGRSFEIAAFSVVLVKGAGRFPSQHGVQPAAVRAACREKLPFHFIEYPATFAPAPDRQVDDRQRNQQLCAKKSRHVMQAGKQADF
jgi:hypothetical protein